MKRIQSILLAIAMLLATPAFFTSCQEDAPEINYTMNVSVINDFTKVVEAINNGFLKNEEAIKKLTEAIDKMNADQQTKLQAIIDVLNSVNATLETKLAAIEAAMKAQTLSLEAKLGLIEAAIKAMPDYSDKFDAVVAALNTMKAQIEALGTGQAGIVEAINNTTAAINSLVAAVNSGNADAAAALAQIIQKLEELKEKIGNGGGGGGIDPNDPANWPVATPEAIDLGLPSGTKWASFNLGATKPSEMGYYYAWSDTKPKLEYTSTNTKYSGTKMYDYTKYTIDDGKKEYSWYDSEGNFIGDGKITLDPEDDAATVNLGAEWSTPEIAQFVELYKYCKKEWKTIDEVQGRVYTGPNKNSIFLPFNGMADRKQKDDVGKQGYYWMKSHRGERYTFFFEFFSVTTLGEGERATFRHFGMGIRPVRK